MIDICYGLLTREPESVFEDHNYFQATISCVYYVCGYIYKMSYLFETLIGSTESSYMSEATLTLLMSNEKLIYPNFHVFNFILVLEKGFTIDYTDIDVFQ